MEVETQSLKRLKQLEEILEELVDKIDKEIIQTDIEWLQLKSIVESSKVFSEEIEISNSSAQQKFKQEQHTQPSTVLDDDISVNTADLQLDTTSHDIDENEEFDSD